MRTKSTNAVRTENFEIKNPALVLTCVDSDISIVESEDGRTTVQLFADSASRREFAANARITSDGSTVTIQISKKKGTLRDLFNFNGGGVSILLQVPRSAVLNLKTVSADIDTNVTVLNLGVVTVSGDVTIHQNPTTHCSVKTVSGDVVTHTFSGCEYSLKSVSGDISVHVAPGLEIEVDGKSVSGDMTSEISLDAESDATFESAGTVSISASTVSGDFTLARN